MYDTILAMNDDEPDRLPAYEILDEIGQGGIATVYRARQRSLNRIVAVRTFREDPEDDQATENLKREAAILTRLQHPHIISVLDCFTHEDRTYLVQEYIEGGTLSAQTANQPQQVRQSVGLVERLARTLAFVHHNGVVHCNLKPRKVLLAKPRVTRPAGDSNLTDFEDLFGIPLLSGFELALDQREPNDRPEGTIVGTPAYMAPEQAQGRQQSIGPATDIYGLGAILYELLSGRPPFSGMSVQMLLRCVIDFAPESLCKLNPSVDAQLDRICQKCLFKTPSERYSSAMELSEELQSYLKGPKKTGWFTK